MDSEHSVPPRIDAQGHPFEQDAEVAPCGCSLLPGGLLCAVHALEVAAPGYTDLFDSPPDIISDIPALELTAPPVPPAPIAKSEREQKAADEAARIASITSVLDETVPLAGELERERWEVLRGDCRLVMARLPENSYDSVVCDPPYGMSEEPDVEAVLKHWLAGDEYEHMTKGGFMGRTWDSFVPGPKFWEAAYRCLKPGGYIAAYSSSRTWDLLSIAMRMAGFEIRDTCMWVYGCLSADTEVLVDGEWVYYDGVAVGLQIWGYDLENHTFRNMPIQGFQKYNYKDVAYKITSDATDQIVSRNHRCVIIENNQYKVVAAEDMGEKRDMPVVLGTSSSPMVISSSATITPVHYNGLIWCPTVPTGAFVARRNGKMFITGNSGMPKGLNVHKAILQQMHEEYDQRNAALTAALKEKGFSEVVWAEPDELSTDVDHG